jgi:GTP1/Obg family GTP-binding protein
LHIKNKANLKLMQENEKFLQTFQVAKRSTEEQKFLGVNTEIGTDSTTAIQQQIPQFNSIEELQTQLLEVIQERDYLLQALKLEQENHAQTRKGLTTALGDAIDSLARSRADRKDAEV